MNTPKNAEQSAHLLDDLESIRDLLGEDTAEPPLLTESIGHEVQIPMLFDVVGAHLLPAEAPVSPVIAAAPAAQEGDELLHLDAELRAAAEAILQDVINDFTPHIETEIRRRLDARLERLLAQYPA